MVGVSSNKIFVLSESEKSQVSSQDFERLVSSDEVGLWKTSYLYEISLVAYLYIYFLIWFRFCRWCRDPILGLGNEREKIDLTPDQNISRP